MKRSIIIIAVVIVVIFAGAAFWFFILRNQSAAPATAGTSAAGGALPTAGTQTGAGGGTGAGGALPSSTVLSGSGLTTQFGIVSDEPVLDYFIDAQNNTTVVEPDGKIATIANGQATFLSSITIQGMLTAGFSHDGAKILVNFGDPANPQTSIFNLTTKAWTPLALGIISPVWSPSDNRIAYLKQNTDGGESLTTLDVSKTTNKPVVLLTLNMEDLTVAWPNKAQVVLSDKPSAYSQGSIWLFDLQKKTLSQPIPAQYGLAAAWSNTTSTAELSFSTAAFGRSGGTLSLMNPAGAAPTQTLSFLTLPSKCAFNYVGVAASSSLPYLTLYCAVPGDQSKLSNAKLPDDYDQMALVTADVFYRVNAATGAMDTVFAPTQGVDATDLRVVNHILFFVNRYDQKLYAISLGA